MDTDPPTQRACAPTRTYAELGVPSRKQSNAQLEIELQSDHLRALAEKERRYFKATAAESTGVPLWDWTWDEGQSGGTSQSQDCSISSSSPCNEDATTRGMAASYLMRVADYFEEDRDIVHVAINYLDRLFVRESSSEIERSTCSSKNWEKDHMNMGRDNRERMRKKMEQDHHMNMVLVALDLSIRLHSPTSGDAFRACTDYVHRHGHELELDGDDEQSEAQFDPNSSEAESVFQPKKRSRKHGSQYTNQNQTNAHLQDSMDTDTKHQSYLREHDENDDRMHHHRRRQDEEVADDTGEERFNAKIQEAYKMGHFYQSFYFSTVHELTMLRKMNTLWDGNHRGYEYEGENGDHDCDARKLDGTTMEEDCFHEHDESNFLSISICSYVFSEPHTPMVDAPYQSSSNTSSLSPNQFSTAKDFASAQKEILTHLNFELHPPTTYQFTRTLLQLLQNDVEQVTHLYARDCRCNCDNDADTVHAPGTTPNMDTSWKARDYDSYIFGESRGSSGHAQKNPIQHTPQSSYEYATDEECNLAMELLTERVLDQCDLSLLLSAPCHGDKQTTSINSNPSTIAVAAIANAIKCTFPPKYVTYLHQRLYGIVYRHGMMTFGTESSQDRGKIPPTKRNKEEMDRTHDFGYGQEVKWKKNVDYMRHELALLYKEQKGDDDDNVDENEDSDRHVANANEVAADTTLTTLTPSSHTKATTHSDSVSTPPRSKSTSCSPNDDIDSEKVSMKAIDTNSTLPATKTSESPVSVAATAQVDAEMNDTIGDNKDHINTVLDMDTDMSMCIDLLQDLEEQEGKQEGDHDEELELSDAPKSLFAPKKNINTASIVYNLYQDFVIPPHEYQDHHDYHNLEERKMAENDHHHYIESERRNEEEEDEDNNSSPDCDHDYSLVVTEHTSGRTKKARHELVVDTEHTNICLCQYAT